MKREERLWLKRNIKCDMKVEKEHKDKRTILMMKITKENATKLTI